MHQCVVSTKLNHHQHIVIHSQYIFEAYTRDRVDHIRASNDYAHFSVSHLEGACTATRYISCTHGVLCVRSRVDHADQHLVSHEMTSNALRCCRRAHQLVRTGVPGLTRTFNTSIPEPVSSTEKSELPPAGTRSYATATALPPPPGTIASALPAAWSSTVRNIWDALGIAWQGAPQQHPPLAPTPPPAPTVVAAPTPCPVELFDGIADVTALADAVARQPEGRVLPVQRIAELVTQHLSAASALQGSGALLKGAICCAYITTT